MYEPISVTCAIKVMYSNIVTFVEDLRSLKNHLVTSYVPCDAASPHAFAKKIFY